MNVYLVSICMLSFVILWFILFLILTSFLLLLSTNYFCILFYHFLLFICHVVILFCRQLLLFISCVVLFNFYMSLYLEINSYSVVCICDNNDRNAELNNAAEYCEPNPVLHHKNTVFLPPILKLKQ